MSYNFKIYTEYSLEKGSVKINKLFKEVKKIGYKNLIITDFNNISGSLEFFEKFKNKKFNILLGCDIETYCNFKSKRIKGNLTIIVKNCLGYKNLCKIISKKKIVPYKKIYKLKGINILSSSNKGLLTNCLKKINNKNKVFKKIKNIILEINIFDKKSYKTSKYIYDIAKKKKIKILCLHPVRFIKKKNFEIFKYKNFIIKKKFLNEDNKYIKKYKNQYLIDKKHYKKFYCKFNENFYNIFKKNKYNFDYKKKKLKFFKKNIKKKYFFKKSIKIFKKKKIFFNNNYKKYYERFLKELKIIYKMGFSNYFFIVRDFIKWSKKKKIIVGPGRGSSSGSLVAYVFGITEIDPIKYGLYFERFLNYKKKSIPDFDIDFCKEKRNDVINYLKKKYGIKKVFNIVTFGKFSFKNSIRDSGRILGYGYNYVDKLSKIFNNIKDYKEFIKFIKKKSNIPNEYRNDIRFYKIINITVKISGYIRNIGKHAGGVIITNKKYYNFMPLYYNNNDKVFITQFDKFSIQKLGFIKFDFLCLNTLSLLNNIIKKLKINFSFFSLDFNNKNTFDLIKKGNTTGVFQLESYQMKKYLRIIKPNSFNDIVNIISLYRPGPICLINDYCIYKGDKYLSKFKKILFETRGILIFQEQLMKILKKGYNFNMYEADIIRSCICKGKKKDIKIARSLFLKKNIKNKDFEFFKKYSGYSFNKAHAVSYSYITYYMAWLKSNYKEVFYICSLNYSFKNKKKIKLLYKDMIYNKIYFCKPHINKSKNFFSIKKKKIYIGFVFIKGIGINVGDEIIKERNQKDYKNFFDFYFRINKSIVNKRVIYSLIFSGCFDCFNKNKFFLISEYENYKKNYNSFKNIFNNQITVLKKKEIKNSFLNNKNNFLLEEKNSLDLIITNLKDLAVKKFPIILGKKFFSGILIEKKKINNYFFLFIESNYLITNRFYINEKNYNKINIFDFIVVLYDIKFINSFYSYYIYKYYLYD
ncbi:DNA polymerase III subunit alpha [Candidatus Vidania fulgoroideorum]